MRKLRVISRCLADALTGLSWGCLENDAGRTRSDRTRALLSPETNDDPGGTAAVGVTGFLTSFSPSVTVLDGSDGLGTIDVGVVGVNTGDRFTLSATPSTYQGFLSLFTLETVFNRGAWATRAVSLTIGQRSRDDPVGQDRYGNWAFDNTDTSYPGPRFTAGSSLTPHTAAAAPRWSWATTVTTRTNPPRVTLPFTFRYYGRPFGSVTFCSDGWIAIGSTYLTDYWNRTIPGAGAPKSMPAAFWDDLYQYSAVSNVDGTDGYATVGIQNLDHTDGLLYAYFNVYPSGAATLPVLCDVQGACPPQAGGRDAARRQALGALGWSGRPRVARPRRGSTSIGWMRAVAATSGSRSGRSAVCTLLHSRLKCVRATTDETRAGARPGRALS